MHFYLHFDFFIMHVYIYDSLLSHKKFNHTLANIETRLTDLGLNGKIIRLNIMKNMRNSVENELKREVKTIIAVGNDQTVNQIINALVQTEQKFAKNFPPIGIIPVGKDKNYIASSLGIHSEEMACDILSARRIEKLDLCSANDSFFISSAAITTKGTILEINKAYSIEIANEGKISVVNLATEEFLTDIVKFNPRDGVFELFIRTKKKKGLFKKNLLEVKESVFPLKKLTIINEKNYPVILDGSVEAQTPIEINIMKQKLNVVVGKERSF